MASDVAAIYNLSGMEGKSLLKVCMLFLTALNNYELNIVKNHVMAQLSHRLMYFRVRISGRELVAMIDSGSSRDIIDQTLHRELNLTSQKIPTISLALADNTPIKCDTISKNTVVRFIDNSLPFAS